MNYVYEGLDTTNQWEDQVKADKVFPFVRELRFKYGLQVYDVQKVMHNGTYLIYAYILCNTMGIPISKVWFDNNEENFNYYSLWYEKSRGSDGKDRRTLRSKKMSTLMTTLKKNEVVPSDEKVLNTMMTDHKFGYPNAVEAVRDKCGNPHKKSDISGDGLHALLKVILEKQEITSLPDEMLSKMKEWLDTYNKKDEIKIEREKKVAEFFNPCYMLSVDGLGQYVVGVIKYKMLDRKLPNGNTRQYEGFEIVKPFKRFKNIDALGEYPDMVSYLTMLKTYSENKFTDASYYGGFVPRVNSYVEDLDMVINNYYTDGSREFSLVQVFTPCSTI